MLTFEALKDKEKYYSTSMLFEEKEKKLTINKLESRLEEHYIGCFPIYTANAENVTS